MYTKWAGALFYRTIFLSNDIKYTKIIMYKIYIILDIKKQKTKLVSNVQLIIRILINICIQKPHYKFFLQ